MKMNQHTIDATGKPLGRVASEAAMILMGKKKADYAPNVVAPEKVTIINASKAEISDKKLKTKQYENYTGYPGGFDLYSMEHVISKKGYGEVFKLAVYGMLPGNKLRSKMMKNLTIKD